MYLHLGQTAVVRDREIVGIFDLDNASWAYRTREFLNRAEREGRTVWLTEDLPRSFVVAERDGETRIYLCPQSAAALRSRGERRGIE